MILAELRLTNYKQYQGEHRVAFPHQGVVAVIGANGVGKTTLFEAIEWCLYNPREIENAEVPPRGGVGHTLVQVVLEDGRDGVRYVVERGLKRGVTTAAVFREDQPEAPLVQGTRQVTQYVAGRLIGLGHRAFVSTFFTRQKELSFFGTLKATDRRREVGRLLGLETIREAQRLVGEEGNVARVEAASLKRQAEEQSAGRDFPAEIALAEATIRAEEAATVQSGAAYEAATTAHTTARAELDRWRELERADEAFRLDLERLAGDERAAGARRDGEATALRRLAEAERTRARLLPLQTAEPERRAAVAAFVVERERWERRRALDADDARAEQAGKDAGREIERAVAAVGAGSRDIPGWTWGAAEAAEPAAAASRLLAATADLDAAEAGDRAERLVACRQQIEDRDAAEAKFGQFRRLLQTLDGERRGILADGEPRAAAVDAQRQREAAVADASSARAQVAAAADQRRKLEAVVQSILAAAAAPVCPTCQRVFRPEEAELTVDAIEDAIAAERQREASLAGSEREARERANAAETRRLAAQETMQRLSELDGRIAVGRPMVEDASALFDQLVSSCTAAIESLSLAGEPTPSDVAQARDRATLLRAVDRARSLLRRLAAEAQRAAAEREKAAAGLAAIGPVAYQQTAHIGAERELEAAVTAAARVAEIDEQLARRPGHQAALAAADGDLGRLAGERVVIEGERTALGFDARALATAGGAEAASLAAIQAAADGLRSAQETAREAIRRREDLRREEARVKDVAIRAEMRQREADELHRMYGEFTRFDQYVAAKVTPRLAEETGQLLAEVTEGKYDRVEFDDNYGLKIFDDDECFPIEEFSGGERDVAALCARLALSRLVGSQAANPPRFLVLDEVFGSLDQDRRAQVLGTLGSLTAPRPSLDAQGDLPAEVPADAFQQLFIVSHVDDVRLSSAVDEVWRVTEVGGVSRWENATQGGGIEDL